VTTRFAEPGARPLAPEKEPSDRSILIGLLGTLLFHVLLVVLSPRFAFDDFSGVHTGINIQSKDQGQSFDFELTDPVREEPAPSQFVETNPDAPANEPDKTNNFSNRNQQAAQLEAPKELDPERRPSITNAQDKIKNETSIVTGDMSEPQMGAAARPESTQTDEQEQKEQRLRLEQVPLSGFDKTEGTAEDGIATNVAENTKPSTNAEQSLEGAKEGQEADGGLLATTASQRPQPKARPRLTAPRSTILTNRVTGVANIAPIGMDARWSEYGEYLNELIEIVQAQWYHILQESRVSPPRGSHVVISFKINSQGETNIVKVEDEGAGRQGVFSCQHAIQARQPYRKWSDQMIAVLGEEQTLDFAFYYQ
jgi:hypothetical protein